MEALKSQLLRKFGMSRSGALKMSFLCTDENISTAQKCARISSEALLDFFRRKALLVAAVRVDGNDDKLYYACKPDGLCSLRACRMATIQELKKSDNLQSDVDINDISQRETFVGELRQRFDEVIGTLPADQCGFVEEVIRRLSCGNTQTMPDGFEGIWWPDETLLMNWI
jgi:hypothetical protein